MPAGTIIEVSTQQLSSCMSRIIRKRSSLVVEMQRSASDSSAGFCSGMYWEMRSRH